MRVPVLCLGAIWLEYEVQHDLLLALHVLDSPLCHGTPHDAESFLRHLAHWLDLHSAARESTCGL